MELKTGISILLVFCGFSNIKYALSQKDVDSAMIAFNKKVFKYITSSDQQSNIIVSPLAIQRQMLLTSQATSGETNEELQKAVELDGADDPIYLDTFAKKPAEFVCNDNVYYSKITKLRKPFLTILKMMFDVTPESIDFTDPKATAQRISNTMEESSNGVIRKFIKEKDIIPTTSICFVTTAVFAGQFITNFNKKNTRMAKFYNWGTSETLVSALYGVNYFQYAMISDLKASILSLPYKDSNEKLLIVLPNNRDGLKKLEEKIMDVDFSLIIRKLRTKLVAVSIPQFNIDYRADLPKMLNIFGAQTILTENSDMSNGFDGIPPSNIPCLFNKFHFDINEYGSSAEEDFKKVVNEYDSPEKFFLVEHPFLFFIHANDSIHFFGRVVVLNINSDNEQSEEIITEPTTDSDEDDDVADTFSAKNCGGKSCNRLL